MLTLDSNIVYLQNVKMFMHSDGLLVIGSNSLDSDIHRLTKCWLFKLERERERGRIKIK